MASEREIELVPAPSFSRRDDSSSRSEETSQGKDSQEPSARAFSSKLPAVGGALLVAAALTVAACFAGAALRAPKLPPEPEGVPLRGEYGALTEFGDLPEEEARARVRDMVQLFNIREFQFYDTFDSYSHPPRPEQDCWSEPVLGRKICRRTLLAMLDEIRRCGGRSWLYVQAMGADPGDEAMQAGHTIAGQHIVNQKPLLDVVVPDQAWALKLVPGWARYARKMGFDGIHWDTLGRWNDVVGLRSDFAGFLRAAKLVLSCYGLLQTANFVDGVFWDAALIFDGTVAFPYFEVWSIPTTEDYFFSQVTPRGGGVFVCYPGKTPEHTGEFQNQHFVGIRPMDLLVTRWQRARTGGNTYLVVADGRRHIQTEYFPNTLPFDDEDLTSIRRDVFGGGNDFPLATRAEGEVPASNASVSWMGEDRLPACPGDSPVQRASGGELRGTGRPGLPPTP